ncbi:MAG TPA: cytochrome c biogenesis protein CcdA, partial [Bryobacteraceae bacterium]|nr:cytochrome c biogenesis protein CcdA [Bryobacteraceae bacterium]
MPRFAAAALVLISAAAVFAQKQNPVQWTVAADPQSVAPGKDLLLKVQARIDPGWHIYSLSTPEGGPTPTTVKLEPNPLFSSTATFQPIPVTKFDKNFQINTEILEAEKSFLIRAGVAPDAKTGPAEAVVQVRYQACTDTECLPRKATLKAAFAIDPGASGNSAALPAGYKPFTGARSVSVSPTSASAAEAQSLPAFLAIAFGFGLAAIFTPCVFPMIPITLSVFLNRQGVTRAQGLANAGLFCLGIIVLFTALGLVVTAVLGPFGVVQLGSNPWVNGFIALVFLVFGLSLLGAFEITLPSGLLTRVDRASQSGGIVGTLLMGLTFSLTSFACVGPFVGPLLASSVQLGGIQPALGMMA